MIKKLRAKRHGVPFKIAKFWPPCYISFVKKTYAGCEVLTDIYDANTGDIVPVLKGEEFTHFYILKSIGRAGGDDHIVSPLQFNIEYSHSEKNKKGVYIRV